MITDTIIAQKPIRDTGFFSPLYCDFVDSDPYLIKRFPCSSAETECWSSLTKRTREFAAGSDVWAGLESFNRGLGANGSVLKNIERLSAGDSVAIIAGQQPDALGGPLYTLHKAATVIALAREFERRTGTRTVPLFWVASEDSDFDEIRSVRFLGSDLQTNEATLQADATQPDGMIGEISASHLHSVWESARSAWTGLSGEGLVAKWMGEVRDQAPDLGSATAGFLLRALGKHGLVIVDPRLPAFRAAARGLYGRYLERFEAVREGVDGAGDELEKRGYGRPIPQRTAEFALYRVEDGTRLKTDPDGAKGWLEKGGPMTANVVLRPIVQDALLPTVMQISGPGEIAYLSQLKEAYETLDTPMSISFPRASMTWLPSQAMDVLQAGNLDPWSLVKETDRTLKELYAEMLPAANRDELESMQRESNSRLEKFSEQVRSLDASLPQMIESARGKIDYQYKRLFEGVLSKVRARFDREHPATKRLRQALLPQDRLQERRIAWLDLVARGGESTIDQCLRVAEIQVESTLARRAEHYVVPIEDGVNR